LETKFGSYAINMTAGVRRGWIGDYIGSLYRCTMEMEQMILILLAEIRAYE
jgi:hypothetical protein